MTDQDNLRERLTALILGRTAPTAAQAIIDEFGLTVEERNNGCTACGEPPESRIVGKWEKQ